MTRDAIITCIVNTLTCLIAGVLVFSILGYMAHIQETTIDEVVNSGPGLVFLTYPDLVRIKISVIEKIEQMIFRFSTCLGQCCGPPSSL